MSDGTAVQLLKGKGNYKGFTFDEAGKQAAFVSDQAEYDKPVSPYRLYYWKPGETSATELVTASTAGMARGMVVSDQAAAAILPRRAEAVSRDGATTGSAGRRRRAGAARRGYLELAGPVPPADAARPRAAGAQSQLPRNGLHRRQAARAAGDHRAAERQRGR